MYSNLLNEKVNKVFQILVVINLGSLVVVLLGCCHTILRGGSLGMCTPILPPDRLLAGDSFGPSGWRLRLYWDFDWSCTQ